MPHRLFLPKEKKRSVVLSLGSLVFANILLLLLIFSRVTTLVHKDLNILGFATDVNITDLLNETNSRRAANGLGALEYNQVLSNAAAKKAEDMFADDYWAHIAPDGTTPWDFIVGSGYKYSYAGENLAKDFSKSKNVVNAWMDSPTHRENILNRNYTQIGFAVVNGVLNGEETTLVVQMFGRPVTSTQIADTNSQDDAIEEAPVEIIKVETVEEVLTEPSTDNLDQTVTLGQQGSEPVSSFTVNAVQEKGDVFVINKIYVTYFAYGILLFFTFSLVIDGFVAFKRGYTRLTGNTITHIIFFILSLVFIFVILSPKII